MKRLRFSLWTLFLLVTIAGLVAWWVNSQRDWIRQRHEFLNGYAHWDNTDAYVGWHPRPRAPFGLWLLGEQGIGFLAVPNHVSQAEQDIGKRLFPEAQIEIAMWGR